MVAELHDEGVAQQHGHVLPQADAIIGNVAKVRQSLVRVREHTGDPECRPDAWRRPAVRLRVGAIDVDPGKGPAGGMGHVDELLSSMPESHIRNATEIRRKYRRAGQGLRKVGHVSPPGTVRPPGWSVFGDLDLGQRERET